MADLRKSRTLPPRMRVKDAAEYLNISTDTLYRMINRGEIGCIRRPGVTRIRDIDILEWEACHLCPAKPKDQDPSDESGDDNRTSRRADAAEATGMARTERRRLKLQIIDNSESQ